MLIYYLFLCIQVLIQPRAAVQSSSSASNIIWKMLSLTIKHYTIIYVPHGELSAGVRLRVQSAGQIVQKIRKVEQQDYGQSYLSSINFIVLIQLLPKSY